MAAVPWQKSFLRVTAGLTAVGIFVIFIGVAVTYSQPAGPDAESPSTLSIAAIPMVMLAVSALLVLYLGLLVERETVLEKLPKFTPCRMTTVVVLLVLLCPVRHLVFALLLIICGVGLVVSFLDSFDLGTSARLIVAAAGDGILCIVQGEVLREAGAAGDVLAAQFGLFLLAGVGGGFLPGLAFVAARRKFPTICRNAAIGYAAMAVHSAVLLMQAIGTEMRFFLDGGGYLFDSPQCLYSTIDSPLSLVLNFLQSLATADEYQGPSGPAAPCPEDAEFVSSDPSIVPLIQMRSCTEMPLIALLFFLLLGAFGAGLVHIGTMASTPSSRRVVPQGLSDTKRRRGLAAGAFISIGLVLVIVLGVLGLECPYEAPRPVMPEEDNAERPVNDSDSSNSSDMTTSTSTQPSTTQSNMIDSNASDGSNSSNDTGSRRLQSMDNDTNATNTTTQTTTTTPSPLLANFTAMEIQQAEEVMYTYHGAMMGQTVEMTGKCILPTGEEPSFVRFEEATDSDCRLLCSLHDECFGYSRDGPLRGMNPRACLLWTQSGLTGHGHGGGLWSCATKILAAEPRNCTSSAPVMKDGIPVEMAPEIWCGCSGAFSRGPWGLVSVIAEQFATFYCELGMIAPMLIGLAGFAIHSFTCSQAVAHLNVLEAQETHRQLVAVGQQGRAVVEEGDQQTNTAMVAWHEARRENLPKPLATLGTSRMFSV
mmetsp:Transcript_20199/g.47818  ORF Transcript_20199/g.47818 Transcript_20199/m.47818 type:complete len:706 (+) Transcript_20199:73-2190(+)